MTDIILSNPVITGNCVRALREYDGEQFAAVITDPPYSSGGMVRGDRMISTNDKYSKAEVNVNPDFDGDTRDQRGWVAWSSLWLEDLLRATVDGGILCMFSDWRMLPSATDAIQAGGWVWRGIIPWNKGSNTRPQKGRPRAQCEYVLWGTKGPRGVRQDDICADGFFTADTERERCHITQKPLALLQQMVRLAPPGSLIADPFAGSGAHIIAALREGRRAIGWEINPQIADIARARIAADMDGLTYAAAQAGQLSLIGGGA